MQSRIGMTSMQLKIVRMNMTNASVEMTNPPLLRLMLNRLNTQTFLIIIMRGYLDMFDKNKDLGQGRFSSELIIFFYGEKLPPLLSEAFFTKGQDLVQIICARVHHTNRFSH